MKRFFFAFTVLILSGMHANIVFAQKHDPLITNVNVEEVDNSGSLTGISATNPAGTSAGDALCWTESACRKQVEADGGTFSSDLFELDPEKCGSSNLGYCYPPAFEYRLIIPFGQIQTVKGFGGYIQALFSLALALAVIGAVLTTMVSGLVLMTARGNARAVDNAKDAISKSMFSILILLLVVSLANLIDPSLKILAPLRTPLVKKADFIEPGSSCEELMKYGYGISAKKGTCGDKATVTSLPPVAENESLVSALAVGDECAFASCNVKNLETCMQVLGEFKCVRCGNVYAAPDAATGADIVPSAGTCGRLTLSRTFAEFPKNTEIKCLYFDAPRANYNACVEVFYPDASAPGVDCDRLKADYGSLGCGMYDYVSVRADGLDGYSYFSALSSGSWLANLEGANGFDTFDAVCGKNICKLPRNCRTEIQDGYTYNSATCVNQ